LLDSTPIDLTNGSMSVLGNITSGGDVSYDLVNIPANSPLTVSITSPSGFGGNTPRYTLRLIDSSTSGCPQSSSCSINGFAQTCSFSIFCPTTQPTLQVTNTQTSSFTNFNISVKGLPYTSIATDSNYPLSSTGTAQYFSFSLGNAESLIVNVNPSAGNLQTNLYFGCKLLSTKTCNTGKVCSHSLVYTGEALAGQYWILVTPTAGNSTYSLKASTGINNCNNVSLQVNFCKSEINAVSQLFNTFDVSTADQTASDAFNAFSAIYNNSCNETLKSFVCNYNFQACDATGLTKKMCYEDCQMVSQLCGSNTCADDVCAQFSTCSITTTESKQTGTSPNPTTSGSPTPSPSGSDTTISTFHGNNAVAIGASILLSAISLMF